MNWFREKRDYLAYLAGRAQRRTVATWCRLTGRHRVKFDTYPRRGLCVRCGYDPRG